MGKLTTHVLDTLQGCPARNLKIELWAIAPPSLPASNHTPGSEEKSLLKTVSTNQDGRTDTPLLAEQALQAQVYELVFYVGEYFQQRVSNLPQPAFLDRVPVRFGIADPTAHYHVPLLTSPWSYSTYRGS